jgi:tRNA(Ile2) C34 agmatinyltransferase TiaS
MAIKSCHAETKRCLRCNRKFRSNGRHNRLCRYCREYTDELGWDNQTVQLPKNPAYDEA